MGGWLQFNPGACLIHRPLELSIEVKREREYMAAVQIEGIALNGSSRLSLRLGGSTTLPEEECVAGSRKRVPGVQLQGSTVLSLSAGPAPVE